MAATPVASFLVGRVQINCFGGGYEHIYPMIAPGLAQASIDLAMICDALSTVLENGSRIYAAILSSLGGITDGYEIYKNAFRKPRLLVQSGALGTETVSGGTANPEIGIRWRLDTGAGITTTRLLRSIRSAWVAGGALIQSYSAPSNAGAAISLGSGPSAVDGYFLAGSGTYNAADALSNYFSIVRDKTAAYRKNPSSPPAYLQYAYLASNGTPGNPDWSVLGISKRPIGEGFPRVRGAKPKFS